MTNTAPLARDARGRFVARAALTAQQPAQQQQANAARSRSIAVARKLTPGAAHLWPAAEGAIYSGTPHAHLTDATLIGYNAPGGVYFAAIYLLGPSAGQHAGRYRVEVCHARAPYDQRLCGTFASLDFACLHLGRVEVLAAYRAKRRAALADAAHWRQCVRKGVRSAADYWAHTQKGMAELRRYYGSALAAIARVSWVPRAPRPVAMVPMPCQQQQADAGRFADDVHAEAAGWLAYVAAHAETAPTVAGFDAAVTEAVDTLLRRHAISPRAATCLLTFFDAPRDPVVAAIVAPAAAMVPMPCQQQQGQARIEPPVYVKPYLPCLSEDAVERAVCKATDRLDAIYMAGQIDEATYKAHMTDLDRWAERQYRQFEAL